MTEAKHHRLVWTEIPVTNLEKARAFYETLLEAPLIKDDNGPQPMLMLPDLQGDGAVGHLYEGKPVTQGDGITAHLAVNGSLDDAMARVAKSGGEIVSEEIAIPAGSFFYAKDTDGNSLGIFKY